MKRIFLMVSVLTVISGCAAVHQQGVGGPPDYREPKPAAIMVTVHRW